VKGKSILSNEAGGGIVDSALSGNERKELATYVEHNIRWDLLLSDQVWSKELTQVDFMGEERKCHVRISWDRKWYAVITLDNDESDETIAVGDVDGTEYIICQWSGCHPQFDTPGVSWCYSHGYGFSYPYEEWEDDIAQNTFDLEKVVSTWLIACCDFASRK
jgi:hypothetical protein